VKGFVKNRLSKNSDSLIFYHLFTIIIKNIKNKFFYTAQRLRFIIKAKAERFAIAIYTFTIITAFRISATSESISSAY